MDDLDGHDGALAKIDEARSRLDVAEEGLCAPDVEELSTFGLEGAVGAFSNNVLYASCTFGAADADADRGGGGGVAAVELELRVAFDGAEFQVLHFSEPEATPVEVVGADRAAVVDRVLYPSEGEPDDGFTLMADFGPDMVQVVVVGVARDATKLEAAARLAADVSASLTDR